MGYIQYLAKNQKKKPEKSPTSSSFIEETYLYHVSSLVWA